MIPVTATLAWLGAYETALKYGRECAPRGRKIRELEQHTLAIDLNYPLVAVPERRLNYRFLAAEAAWILAGRNDLGYLTAFNPKMAEFSDNGRSLAGAYGPRITSQVDYVVEKLVADRDTRQATLTIWTPNPQPSRDLPCTVAMDFKIRRDRLNAHVFMRSSDLWLGVPYDVFSFAMVASYIAARYREIMTAPLGGGELDLGTLYLTAASMHVYEEHWDALPATVYNDWHEAAPLPPWLERPESSEALIENLEELALQKRGGPLRWWEGIRAG